jgi:NNP family nitrate/nitrite transporter-like MFS transporter
MALILLLGSIPLGFSVFASSGLGIIVSRVFIGLLGATFVPCQYWTTALFSSNVVGTANAIAGGWGNMGAGVTYLVMPRIYNLFHYTFGIDINLSWRISMVVPVVLLWVVAFMCYKYGIDKPGPEFITLSKTSSTETLTNGTNHASEAETGASTAAVAAAAAAAAKSDVLENRVRDPATAAAAHHALEMGAANPEALTHSPIYLLFKCITNVNVIILMFNYACSFGVELSVDGAIGNYFIANFGLDQSTGSLFGALFGLMNLFSRATGGLISDYAGSKYGQKGRIYWHALLFVISSASLIVFSYLPDMASSIVFLIIFSYAVQAGCGSTFGIVPFIGPYMGSASGLIGAGGNIGGALFNVLLRYYVGRTRLAFMYMGVTIALGGFLLCFGLVVKGEYMLQPLMNYFKKKSGKM